MGGAFVCAFVFVIMLYLSVPPTDGAYGMSLSYWFSDSGGLAALVAAVCGLVSFPLTYFSLRRRRLVTSATFTFAVVLLEIVTVTPLLGLVGFFGSFPALAGALLICRFSGYRAFDLVPAGSGDTGSE
jgi:hypothetical protein